MCENGCDGCTNDCQGCGDEAGLDVALLKGLEAVITVVKDLNSRVAKLEKQNKKLKKLKKLVSRGDIGEDAPSDSDIPDAVIDGLLLDLVRAVSEDFATDHRGIRVPIEKRPKSGETAPPKAKAEVTGKPTETKEATGSKESGSNPNSVTITLTKSKGKKPSTAPATMYSVPEYLAATGMRLSPDKLKNYTKFMEAYATFTSDRSVKPDGTKMFSIKALNEGLLQFLS